MPGIRQTLKNGSLWLQPMPPELYRQEVHSAIVNCLAENEIGAILSRDIQITAGIYFIFFIYLCMFIKQNYFISKKILIKDKNLQIAR